MAEIEGFICPLCMQMLPGVSQLEEHVREEHSDTTTGKLKANFRQFIGKAYTTLIKTKDDIISEGAAAVASPRINIELEEDNEEDRVITNVCGTDIELWPPQEFGNDRNHLAYFRRVRDNKEQRIAVDTNRLVVRLEKLLKLLRNEHSMKQKQLKALEQDIVPWKKDSDQKWCMKCRKEFTVRRRRHHCRLCGDVICKRCSSFLPLSEAYQLISDSPAYHDLLPSSTARHKKHKFRNVLKDDDEEDDDDSSDELRVCPECEELLVRRLARMMLRGKVLITALYEKMQLIMNEADKMKPLYLEMADSLLNGEFHYRLSDAHKRRQELIKMYETVDSISKQILGLKYDNGEEPSPTCQKVQRSVRVHASNYLQENLLTLQALPTREKLKEIREARERDAEEKRQALIKQKERQRQLEEAAAAAAISKKESKLEVSYSSVDNKCRVSPTFTKKAKAILGMKTDNGIVEEGDGGWTAEPAISTTLDDEFDPFELQRQQLLSYIDQAIEAKRFDEVSALQESLQQIEILMYREEPT